MRVFATGAAGALPIWLSGKEIVKALTKEGWIVKRVSGSHHVMESPAAWTVCYIHQQLRPDPGKSGR